MKRYNVITTGDSRAMGEAPGRSFQVLDSNITSTPPQ